MAFAATAPVPWDVTIRAVRFNGAVVIDLAAGAGHRVVLDRVVLRATTTTVSHAAIYLIARVPATISVLRADIRTSVAQGDGIEFDAINDTGVARLEVIGTRVSARGNSDSGGGMNLYARGTGAVQVDLYNVVVHDVARCGCGGASGIHLLGGSTADARFRIAGLTMDRSGDDGLVVDDRMEAGGSMTVHAYNSIFSRNTGSGIAIGATIRSTLTFAAGRNDFHANGDPNVLQGRSLGSGNLTAPPRYVAASTGNLRLRSDSPLIDRGVVCSPAGVGGPDADGRHRLAGRSVDMGAHESAAGEPTGIVFVGKGGADVAAGTTGADLMCGYGGTDDLAGGGGADYLDGGEGRDLLMGGGGRDRLFGRGGADTLCAADGHPNDHLDGGPGTDGYDADPGDQRTSVEQRLRPCVN